MSNNTVVSKPLLVALGVVVGAALLFVFVITPLLLDTDDSAEVLAPVPQPTAPADEPDGDAEVADDDRDGKRDGGRRQGPAETDAPLDARDPFAQLVSDETPVEAPATEPAAQTAAAPPPGSTTTTADGTTTTTTADGTTTTTTADGTTTSTADGTTQPPPTTNEGTSTQPEGDVFTLVDVVKTRSGTRKAVVTVNGIGYSVKQGETFAGGRYQLLEFPQPPCATFLYGDSRFTLREGESVQI